MKIGAHVSTAGGIDLSFDRALEIGADCTQIFLSPPQQWRTPDYDPAIIDRYLAKQKESGIGPNFVHGIYLINLATDNPDNLQKGIDWLTWSQTTCAKLDLAGTNFHLGSHKGNGFESVKNQIIKALADILAKTQLNQPYLILENSAGSSVGGKLEELGFFIKELKDPRVKVCIDTQHAFASGYDLKTKQGIEDFLGELDRLVGIKNVVMIHANDSKTELGSGRDRHENIGEGLIGKGGFEYLINHKSLSDIPFILEVPGIQGNGPDRANIDTLRSLIKHRG